MRCKPPTDGIPNCYPVPWDRVALPVSSIPAADEMTRSVLSAVNKLYDNCAVCWEYMFENLYCVDFDSARLGIISPAGNIRLSCPPLPQASPSGASPSCISLIACSSNKALCPERAVLRLLEEAVLFCSGRLPMGSLGAKGRLETVNV